LGRAKEVLMHIYHWHFTASEIWWGGLAWVGCIAMVTLEAVAFRLLVRGW